MNAFNDWSKFCRSFARVMDRQRIPFNAFSEKMCLTAGLVFLVFVVVFFTFSLAVLIFCCEVLHKKMEVGYSEEYHSCKIKLQSRRKYVGT